MLISILDQQLRFSYVSRVFAPHTLASLIGTHPWDFVPECDRDRVEGHLRACLATGATQRYWVEYPDSDGESWHVRAEKTPVGVICMCYLLPSSARLLVPDELEVMRLMAGGVKQTLIADRLGLSQPAISRRRSAIRRKLGTLDQSVISRIMAAME